MLHIAKNTERFEERRKNLSQAQNVILNLPIVSGEETAKGVIGALKEFKELEKSGALLTESTQGMIKKMISKTADDFNNYANQDPKATGVSEKNFENLYGAIVTQAMAAHTDWLLGKSNGFLDYRNATKTLSIESQGIIANAINTILSVSSDSDETIDIGYLELYSVTDALLNKSSGKIVNFANHIIVQKLQEGQEIEIRTPMSAKSMEDTEYVKYGSGLRYINFEREMTEFVESVGGVNGLLRAMRTKMAKVKSSEAYKNITKKPNANYVGKGIEFAAYKPDPATADFTDKVEYDILRFLHNLKYHVNKFLVQAKKDGVDVGANPTIHCLYNPQAPGSYIVEFVLQRLATVMLKPLLFPVSITQNIVFHASSEVPMCGAWETVVENGEILTDSNHFEITKEAASPDSFGVMLVLPKRGNVHGVNTGLFSASQESVKTDTVAYYTFERFTFHASKFQRYWVTNLTPAYESAMQNIETEA